MPRGGVVENDDGQREAMLADGEQLTEEHREPSVAGHRTVGWLWREAHRGADANPAKRFYLATTAALFVLILVNPIAGFLGYVGSRRGVRRHRPPTPGTPLRKRRG